MTGSQIYLDYAAATPMDPAVHKAMQPFFSAQFFNPSALYLAAKSVAATIDGARGAIAKNIGVRSTEIVFTAGGTEANNLVIHGVMEQFPEATIVVSAIEHESVIAPAQNYKCRYVSVDGDGVVNVDELRQKIDDSTVLVSVMYVNNEVGVIQPITQIANLIKEVRIQRKRDKNTTPLYFHTDACQATQYLDLHVNRLGVDFMTLNGGKIYGPKQSGVLYVRGGIGLSPIIYGGGQERNMRSGTENVPAIMGFSAALSLVQKSRAQESIRVIQLQAEFMKLLHERVPVASINGSLKHRIPNNVHITIPGVDNERLLMQMDEQGIQCAVGSACSASNDEPSHVLRALGLSDTDARSSLRFTFGKHTKKSDIARTVEVLADCLNRLQT